MRESPTGGIVVGVPRVDAALARRDGVPIGNVRGDAAKRIGKGDIGTDAAVSNDGPEDARTRDRHGRRGEVGARIFGVGGDSGEDEGKDRCRNVLHAIASLGLSNLASTDVGGGIFHHETAVW